MISNSKIVVGLSGGVDSSLALILLKKQGWQPIGVSLKLLTWRRKKSAKNQSEVAEKVCCKLKIPYYVVDASFDFKKEVVDYFTKELKSNRTPNPCVACNARLKFAKLFEFAKKVGVDYVATGHYSRIKEAKSQKLKAKSYELLMSKDKNKDQSYYLSFLPQKWLSHIIFPLGEYRKEEVYQLAKKNGFDFWKKDEQSQDFCYLAGNSLEEFIKREIKTKPGLIIDTDGKILGKHKGLPFYTIGQRKGIRMGGGPYFVKKFATGQNQLIVTKDKKEIYKKEILLSPFNFVSGQSPVNPIKIMAKVRYRQPLELAILFSPVNNKLRIVFDQPQPSVTPGQACVFYKNQICLGGGIIQ